MILYAFQISARDLECKPIQELVESEKIQNETEKQINKILIPGLFKTTGGKVTREKSKNKVSEMRRTTSTERTQELMREKWRQYKRNYRQRMRNKVVRPAYHSPGVIHRQIIQGNFDIFLKFTIMYNFMIDRRRRYCNLFCGRKHQY